jgi:Ca-activated chloride channel family protein
MPKLLSSVLGVLCALTASAAAAAPITLEASLRNRQLDSQEGDTYLRVSVKAQAIHLDKRLPMNLAVVIDRSGSMSSEGPSGSEKMADAKKSAQFLIDQLDERDTLTVVSFDDGAEVLASAAHMTPANRERAQHAIDPLFARGGTDMIAGLGAGIAQVTERLGQQEQVNRVILISDGVPNVEQGLLEMARQAQGKGIGISTLGVGTDYNENLMTGLANAGNGGYYFVADASKLPSIFSRELHSLMAVVARNAALKIEFGSGVKPTKVYGYDAQVGAESTIIRLGDLVGGQTSEVLLRLHHPALTGEHPIAHVELKYQDAFKRELAQQDAELAANFVSDRKVVEASLDAVTYAKTEQVATAEAVNEAMDDYAAGNKDKAKKVLATRRAELNAAPPAPMPASVAPRMAKANASLDFADSALAGAPAASMGYAGADGVSAASKAAKEDVREMSR